MTHVLGEQFRDRLSDMGLSHIADSDERFITGQDLGDIYERSNIVLRRSSPVALDLTPYYQGGYEGRPSQLAHSEPLRTSQGALRRDGFLQYLEHGAPEHDPSVTSEGVPYLPYVFRYGPRGNKWVDDGHHRIVTSRLNGEHSLPVYEDAVQLPHLSPWS